MQTHLVEQAARIVTSPQVLVNLISKRVRQLAQGHRPMVEAQPRMGLADIALAEVIAGKLTFESPSEAAPELIAAPDSIKIVPFKSEKLAA